MFNIHNIIEIIITVIATALTLTVHEFCHGFAAYKLGDDTPKVYGRLTLNPLRHIDWIGALCLAIFKFGWAKPVPVNISNMKNPRKGIFVVSLAGPLSNFVFAFISMLFIYLIPDLNSQGWYYIAILLRTLVLLNLGIGLFNLIPVPPLDGSKIVAAFLKGGAAYRYLSIQRYSGFILFLCFVMPGISNILSNILIFIENRILFGYAFIIEKILGVF